MQYVSILGSTGTIGKQTLDVIAEHASKYKVYALAANSNVDVIFQQCLDFLPIFAVLLDTNAAKVLRAKLKEAGSKVEVLEGLTSLEKIASDSDVDIVMAAIVGAAGLQPAMAAARAGKRILLANKETLVMAGSLFMKAVKDNNATLLPIDSEHNAIFQVMPTQPYKSLSDVGINKLILTASGGPFRQFSQEQLKHVTKALALKHPNWVMGAKITIDSASLMNKGLEVIEAHWLFKAKPQEIEVIVHPQSVIHSMVEYVDGSVLAQLGNPDMRTPIAYALGYPDRLTSGVEPLNFLEVAKLEFEAPDTQRFPCLRLAFDALKIGGSASTILNAANEIAVAAFLKDQIHFLDIASLIENTLNQNLTSSFNTIEDILNVDAIAREYAQSWVKKGSRVQVTA